MPASPLLLRATGAVSAVTAGYFLFYRDNNPASNDYGFSVPPPRESKQYTKCLDILRQKSHDPISREEIIARMKQHSNKENPCDFFVIGGGAVGSGAALEAQARGLQVVLAEKEDFASGASSKSTKLIHGGVRYLEKAFLGMDFAQLKLVYEALRERAVLLSQAPHLCHELPTMVPCFSKLDLAWFWAGMKAYDFLAVLGGSHLPLSRIVWPGEVRRWFPSLKQSSYQDPYNNNKVASDSHVVEKTEKELQQNAVIAGEKEGVSEKRRLEGAVVYYDGQMDDARLNVSVALTANALGAACGNYCSVVGFIFDEEKKRVIGAKVKDDISGENFSVYSRTFLNATGAFSDKIRSILNKDLDEALGIKHDENDVNKREDLNYIVPATGAHITVPKALTLSATHYGGGSSPALLIPKTQDGRVLFVAPWNGKTIAGTTDNKTDDISNSPPVTQKDVDFILQTMKPYFNFPIENSDVTSSWCGIRPLAVNPEQLASQRAQGKKETQASSQNIVREHVVFGESRLHGFASIAGGKWTTYNKMSCDAVTQTIQLSDDEKLKTEMRTSDPVSRYLKLVGGQQVPLNLELMCSEALEKTEKKLMATASASSTSLLQRETGRFCRDDVARHLATSYGDRSFLILDMILQQQKYMKKQNGPNKVSSSSSSWFGGSSSTNSDNNRLLGLDILYPSLPILSIEVLYACQYELCETPADFLSRRSRAAFLDAAGILRNKDYVKKVAEIMGGEKGWDSKRIEKETETSIERLTKEFNVVS